MGGGGGPGTSSTGSSSGRTAPCRYFSGGKTCKDGDKCKFAHIEEGYTTHYPPPYAYPMPYAGAYPSMGEIKPVLCVGCKAHTSRPEWEILCGVCVYKLRMGGHVVGQRVDDRSGDRPDHRSDHRTDRQSDGPSRLDLRRVDRRRDEEEDRRRDARRDNRRRSPPGGGTGASVGRVGDDAEYKAFLRFREFEDRRRRDGPVVRPRRKLVPSNNDCIHPGCDLNPNEGYAACIKHKDEEPFKPPRLSRGAEKHGRPAGVHGYSSARDYKEEGEIDGVATTSKGTGTKDDGKGSSAPTVGGSSSTRRGSSPAREAASGPLSSAEIAVVYDNVTD